MRLRLRRRIAAVAVVFASACGAFEIATVQQEIIVLSNGDPHFGDVTVGAMKTTMFSFTPQTAGVDDDTITSVLETAGDCTAYTLMGPPPLPSGMTGTSRVFYGSNALQCNSIGGSGSGTNAFQSPGSGSSGGGVVCAYIFTATFAPTLSGATQCDVTITYHQTSQPQNVSMYVLHLDGNGIKPAGISVHPATLPFGNVRVGSTSTIPLTVTNTGGMPLTVSTMTTDPAHLWFSSTPTIPGSFNIGPGTGSNVDVRCSPPSAGGSNATLDFHGATPTSATADGSASLSCTGIITFLDIAPIPINFANTAVGRPPPPKMTTVTNTGLAGNLTVARDGMAIANGVTLQGNYNGPIGAGASIQVGVAWSAAAEHTGTLGALVVHIDTDGLTNNFNVGINGQADIATMATLPGTLDFGPLCAGRPGTAALKLYASGAADVNVVSASVSPAVFTAAPLSGVLMGGHQNDLTATVTANPAATGDFTGQLTVVTDIPGMTTDTIMMKGTALAGGVGATPDLVHFGAVMAGLVSSEQQVVLTNCGAADLSVTAVGFTGENPTDFTVLSPTSFPVAIPKSQSATFNVAMTPHSIGPKSAMLTITHESGMTTALFDGMGVGGDEGNKDRQTYYACSIGGFAAAWPIGVALIVLRRRRRRRLS